MEHGLHRFLSFLVAKKRKAAWEVWRAEKAERTAIKTHPVVGSDDAAAIKPRYSVLLLPAKFTPRKKPNVEGLSARAKQESTKESIY